MSIFVNSRSIFCLSWKNALAHWQLKTKGNYIHVGVSVSLRVYPWEIIFPLIALIYTELRVPIFLARCAEIQTI